MTLLGIDVGGTFIKYGLVNANGAIIEQYSVDTGAMSGRDAVINRIISCAQQLLSSPQLPSALLGSPRLGIGVPGIVNNGYVQSPPNLPGWDMVPLQEILERELGVSVTVENDANAAALAECKLGAGREHKDFLFATLGTGVGGGIIVNNALYRGPHGIAGEIGHIIVDPNAPALDPRPFRRGVLESLIGGQVLERQYGASVREIDEAARSGDERAIAFLVGVGETLGLALCSALATIGLRVVVVGGGISRSDILLNSARETVKHRAIPVIAQSAIIERAHFLHDTGLIGAALLTH